MLKLPTLYICCQSTHFLLFLFLSTDLGLFSFLPVSVCLPACLSVCLSVSLSLCVCVCAASLSSNKGFWPSTVVVNFCTKTTGRYAWCIQLQPPNYEHRHQQ